MSGPHLYDLPVSNNGARVGIASAGDARVMMSIVSPELGGLRSEEYLKVNPQGKMPALSCRDENGGARVRYHCPVLGGNLTAARLFTTGRLRHAEGRPSIQTPRCYLAHPGLHVQGLAQAQAYDAFPRRCDFRNQKQLKLIQRYADSSGPYLAGSEPSQTDALFPAIFAHDAPEVRPRVPRWPNTQGVRHAQSTDQ